MILDKLRPVLAPEIVEFWRDNLRAQIAGRIIVMQGAFSSLLHIPFVDDSER
jgi:hypothetical protein